MPEPTPAHDQLTAVVETIDLDHGVFLVEEPPDPYPYLYPYHCRGRTLAGLVVTIVERDGTCRHRVTWKYYAGADAVAWLDGKTEHGPGTVPYEKLRQSPHVRHVANRLFQAPTGNGKTEPWEIRADAIERIRYTIDSSLNFGGFGNTGGDLIGPIAEYRPNSNGVWKMLGQPDSDAADEVERRTLRMLTIFSKHPDVAEFHTRLRPTFTDLETIELIETEQAELRTLIDADGSPPGGRTTQQATDWHERLDELSQRLTEILDRLT